MEHQTSSSTSSSARESNCVYPFDPLDPQHQLLSVTGGTNMPQAIVQPRPRSSALYGHCSQDPLLVRSGHVSPPYHFGVPQQTLSWPIHTSLPSSPPLIPSNAQLQESVSLQSPVMSTRDLPTAVGPQVPVSGFVEPFFQRFHSSMQREHPYQGKTLHNLMIRHPGGGVNLWRPYHQPPSTVTQGFFNYNGAPPPRSPFVILRPTPRHVRHSPYTCGNPSQTGRHVYHAGLSSLSHNCNAAQNGIVRPIPIYSSRPLVGFGSPSSSAQFESNSVLRVPTAKEQSERKSTQVTDEKDHTEALGDERQKELRVEPKFRTTSTSVNSKLMAKKRGAVSTVVDLEVDCRLEDEFQSNASPSQAEMLEMANKYKIPKSVIRSWFSNRRQKQKKLEKNSTTPLKGKTSLTTSCFKSTDPVSKLVIPSQTHDITVEVPSINPKDKGSIIHKDYA